MMMMMNMKMMARALARRTTVIRTTLK